MNAHALRNFFTPSRSQAPLLFRLLLLVVVYAFALYTLGSLLADLRSEGHDAPARQWPANVARP